MISADNFSIYKVAIVGFGYWGPKLLRNFKAHNGFNVVAVVDIDPGVFPLALQNHPELRVYTCLQKLFDNEEIDAVVISTPASTHFEIAEKCLNSNKHVLIEKPMATNYEDASKLVLKASKEKLSLLVDHTFLYNGVVEKIKSIIDHPSFGKLLYIDSTRINLGIFQSDINVVWDLAVHDLYIVYYLLSDRPKCVKAIGVDHNGNGIENISYVYLKYDDFFVHLNCSWSSPVKIRQMLIGGAKKAILYNDIEPTDKIKVYQHGVSSLPDQNRKQVLQDYRVSEVAVPKYDTLEPLSAVAAEFYEMIKNDKKSRSSGTRALEIVYTLESIQKSIDLGGEEILLDWDKVGR